MRFQILNSLKLTPTKGFTLTEVMITVAIITILASVGTYSWQEVSRRAQANKIATDVREIKNAWELWRVDSSHAYPSENEAGYVDLDRCVGSDLGTAVMASTHLYQNTALADSTVLRNWQGPYLTTDLRDPWGNQYGYDNDLDAATGETCTDNNPGNTANIPHRGVNVTIDWCTANDAQYLPLMEILDQSIDSGDGFCRGTFRWVQRAWGGRAFYRIDPILNN